MGKKDPCYGKSMNTNFPGSPHTMGFEGFSREPISQTFPIRWSHAMGNWWENTCISHMMKYTTWWKPNGKKHPFSGTSTGTQFQAFPIRWISLSFPMLWEIDEKTYAFPMWQSIKYTKYEYQFPRFSLYSWFTCIFLFYRKVYHSMGISWVKTTHTMGKV